MWSRTAPHWSSSIRSSRPLAQSLPEYLPGQKAHPLTGRAAHSQMLPLKSSSSLRGCASWPWHLPLGPPPPSLRESHMGTPRPGTRAVLRAEQPGSCGSPCGVTQARPFPSEAVWVTHPLPQDCWEHQKQRQHAGVGGWGARRRWAGHLS